MDRLDHRIRLRLSSVDVHDVVSLSSCGKDIRSMVLNTSLPSALEQEIRQAYEQLKLQYKGDIAVAVRSSATAEDLPEASFAGLQAIRDDYYEASKLMGASRWQTIWNVTLPLLRPSIALALILSIAGSIQAYEQFVIMTRGGPSNSTKTLVMHTVDMGFDYFKLGPAASLGVIIMIILFVLTVIQLRLFRKNY